MIITKTTTRKFVVKAIAMGMFDFNESFRRIRSKFKYKGNSCFNCGHLFSDGEKISLVQFENYANRLVCANCANQINETLKQEEK